MDILYVSKYMYIDIDRPYRGRLAAWDHIHGVRLCKDHSILQIPAYNYPSRSDSASSLL